MTGTLDLCLQLSWTKPDLPRHLALPPPNRYILDAEPNEFVLVYYKGSNDAWDGYGGAFLYTREPTVKPELIPRLEGKAVSCGPKAYYILILSVSYSCR